MPHQVNIGLAICTPIPFAPGPLGPRLAPVTTEWHRARMGLVFPTNFAMFQIYCDGLEVGDARNEAVRAVLHDYFGRGANDVMKRLRRLGRSS